MTLKPLGSFLIQKPLAGGKFSSLKTSVEQCTMDIAAKLIQMKQKCKEYKSWKQSNKILHRILMKQNREHSQMNE